MKQNNCHLPLAKQPRCLQLDKLKSFLLFEQLTCLVLTTGHMASPAAAHHAVKLSVFPPCAYFIEI